MISSVDILMQKAVRKPLVSSLFDKEFELIPDELALEVRGGDKDYSPTYEHEVERRDKFSDPSILLRL